MCVLDTHLQLHRHTDTHTRAGGRRIDSVLLPSPTGKLRLKRAEIRTQDPGTLQRPKRKREEEGGRGRKKEEEGGRGSKRRRWTGWPWRIQERDEIKKKKRKIRKQKTYALHLITHPANNKKHPSKILLETSHLDSFLFHFLFQKLLLLL